jgi:sulfatase modifying factor 1
VKKVLMGMVAGAVMVTVTAVQPALSGDKGHAAHDQGAAKGTKGSAGEAAKEKDMIVIPHGEFTMGSKEHADEPAHQIVLDAYAIDKFEASNERFKEFMKATGHPAPAYWDDPRLNKANHPVVGVNWNDANAFCKWDGKRLPTEAEWERAAKGPDGDRHYPWAGHDLSPTKANYGQMNGSTKPVDSYPEGRSGYGLYNMAGNVFEWVSDWYDPKYYKDSPALNPQGPDKGYNFANQGQVRVLRGGSWLAPETSLHASHRFWNQPENNSYGVGLGFRCAKSVEGAGQASAQPADNAKWMDGRDAYMQALISMGQEKHADAMASIEKALAADPNNKEYKDVRDVIKKNLKK